MQPKIQRTKEISNDVLFVSGAFLLMEIKLLRAKCVVVSPTGYKTSGITTVTCQASYTWSTLKLLCIKKDCGLPPAIQNGDYEPKGQTSFATQITYFCDKGWMPRFCWMVWHKFSMPASTCRSVLCGFMCRPRHTNDVVLVGIWTRAQITDKNMK